MPGARRFGRAWLALTLVLAARVADEALTGFLAVYNPIVRALGERFRWFPMPAFEFRDWIAGLCVAVAVLLLLTPLAYGRSRVMTAIAYPFGALMFLNGVGHLALSVYLSFWAPGTTTAPLLLVASVWLLASTRR
jgi:hypothetical protein